jgi:F-box-like
MATLSALLPRRGKGKMATLYRLGKVSVKLDLARCESISTSFDWLVDGLPILEQVTPRLKSPPVMELSQYVKEDKIGNKTLTRIQMKASPAGAPPLTTANNERLPYEILGLIFHQYSSNTHHRQRVKLETLLLVCKSWYFAALEHKTLWSCLKIDIHDPISLSYWHFYIPLQLSRSSPTALLDIDLFIGELLHETEELTSIALMLIGTGAVAASQSAGEAFPSLSRPIFCRHSFASQHQV